MEELGIISKNLQIVFLRALTRTSVIGNNSDISCKLCYLYTAIRVHKVVLRKYEEQFIFT
jgi:hypothetical protein